MHKLNENFIIATVNSESLECSSVNIEEKGVEFKVVKGVPFEVLEKIIQNIFETMTPEVEVLPILIPA